LQNLFLDFLYWFNWFVLIFFVSLNLFYTFLLIVSALSIRSYNRNFIIAHDNREQPELTKPFSLLIPAYNESAVIVASVTSFLKLDFPEYEAVVVNDGSRDDTMDKLIEAFQLDKVDFDHANHYPCKEIREVYFSRTQPRLVVVNKVNGGKADALNAAANCARYPYICAVDADSLLSVDSMRKLMQYFAASPQTIGVGGIVRVSNGCHSKDGIITDVRMPKSILEQIQVVEYLRAFLFGRMGWSYMNILLVISGAFGVFRQDITAKVKGWNQKSVGEDMELVTRLHRYVRENGLHNSLSFAPDPVCWTQVPADLRSLSTQRDRWQRGLTQTLVWNISMLFNPKYGRIGMVGMPYFFLYEMLGCVVETMAFPVVGICFYLGIVNLTFFWLFFFVAIIWGLFLTYFSILLEEISYSRYRTWKDLLRLFLAGFLENFGYRQLFSFSRLKGFIKYIFRFKSTWGTIKRTDIA